jgi:hypothetical protein
MVARKATYIAVYLFASGFALPLAAKEYVFGEPEPVGPPASEPGRPDYYWSLSSDGLSVYFNPQLVWPQDIWVSTRTAFDQPWSNPLRLPSPVNAPNVDDSAPEISPDGLSLLFTSERAGGLGDRDLWMSTRSDVAGTWDTIVNLAGLNSALSDDEPELRFDGKELLFQRNFSDVFVATRPSASDAWGAPTPLGPQINFANRRSTSPVLTPDGLTMLFSSDVDGGEWDMDIYMSSRPDLESAWGPATRLGPEINTAAVEWAADVGSDGFFYFNRADQVDAWTSYEIWRATISAVAIPGDFNADGTVDAADYVVWRKGLGTTYTQTDYDMWHANFGKMAGSGAALPSAEPLSDAVPEPSSELLIMFALGLTLSHTRRGQIRSFSIAVSGSNALE